MFAEFAFVITLAMPVFDATQQITVKAVGADAGVAASACEKGRKAAVQMLRDLTAPAHVSECRNVTPAPSPLDDELEK